MAITNVAFVKKVDVDLLGHTIEYKFPKLVQDMESTAITSVLDPVLFDHYVTTITGKRGLLTGDSVGKIFMLIAKDVSMSAILESVTNINATQSEYQFRTFKEYLPTEPISIVASEQLRPPKGIENLDDYTYVIDDSMYSMSSSVKFFKPVWYGDYNSSRVIFKKGDIVHYTGANGNVAFYRVINEPKQPIDFAPVKLTGKNNYKFITGTGSCTINGNAGEEERGYQYYYNYAISSWERVNYKRCYIVPNTAKLTFFGTTAVEVKPVEEIQEYFNDIHIGDLISKEGEIYVVTENTNYRVNINDTSLFEKIDYKFGWNYMGKANPYRLNDFAIDTFTETQNGGCITYQPNGDCPFDFVAVEQAFGNEIKVDILDATDNVVETKTSTPTTANTYFEYDFYDCCLTNRRKCDFTLDNYEFNLDQEYDSTHKIRLCTEHYAIAGSLFVGKSLELPCVDADLNTRIRLPKELKVNEITGIREILPNINVKFRETSLIIYFKDELEAADWLPQLETLMDDKIYFNTAFEYTDPVTGVVDTRFDFLGHSGFLEDVSLSMKNLSISCSVRQYNNG